MRSYQRIWIQLKQKKQVSITANARLHRRIIKAVTKEKYMDIGYKLQLGNNHAFLTHDTDNSIITFYLKTIYVEITAEHLT